MQTNHCHFTVPREKQVRVITDTDFFNEADDPFAVAQALLSPMFDNVALVAAHCGRGAEQMEQSYLGLHSMVEAMAPDEPVTILHGAPHALPDKYTPVVSEGAECIVREAMKNDDRPLYVLLLGPLTDLASALLMEPRIAKRVTAIWIGGGAYPVGGPEFNLGNDVTAVNVVFGSQMAVWQVPKNVYEMMPVSLAELDLKVRPQGALGRWLFDQMDAYNQSDKAIASAFRTGETWVLGDNPAPGLLLYEHRFEFDWVPAPYVTADQTYAAIGRNRPIRVYRGIDSRLILDDLYAKLALYAQYKGEASC